jgi:hypothetical protein
MTKHKCFKCKKILKQKHNIFLSKEARDAIGITKVVPLNSTGNMEVILCDKCHYEWNDIYNGYMNQLTWAGRWAKFMGEKEVFIFR